MEITHTRTQKKKKAEYENYVSELGVKTIPKVGKSIRIGFNDYN